MQGYAGGYHLLSTSDNVLFACLRAKTVEVAERRKIIAHLQSRYAFLSTSLWQELTELAMAIERE